MLLYITFSRHEYNLKNNVTHSLTASITRTSARCTVQCIFIVELDYGHALSIKHCTEPLKQGPTFNDLQKWDHTIIELELDLTDKRRQNLWQWKSVQIISVKPTVISRTLAGILAWNYSQIQIFNVQLLNLIQFCSTILSSK